MTDVKEPLTDVKEPLAITMPLYKWLMLIGALGNLPDQSWYDQLVDQILEKVQP